MRGVTSATKDELANTHLIGQLVQCAALNQLTACVGEKSLTLTGKMLVHDMPYGSIENGIAKKLQTLVIHGFALGIATHDALMHQGQFVITDIVWIETDDTV